MAHKLRTVEYVRHVWMVGLVSHTGSPCPHFSSSQCITTSQQISTVLTIRSKHTPIYPPLLSVCAGGRGLLDNAVNS